MAENILGKKALENIHIQKQQKETDRDIDSLKKEMISGIESGGIVPQDPSGLNKVNERDEAIM